MRGLRNAFENVHLCFGSHHAYGYQDTIREQVLHAFVTFFRMGPEVPR